MPRALMPVSSWEGISQDMDAYRVERAQVLNEKRSHEEELFNMNQRPTQFRPVAQWKGVATDLTTDDPNILFQQQETERRRKQEAADAYRRTFPPGKVSNHVLGPRSIPTLPRAQWTGLAHYDPSLDEEAAKLHEAKAAREQSLYLNRRKSDIRPKVFFDPPYEVDEKSLPPHCVGLPKRALSTEKLTGKRILKPKEEWKPNAAPWFDSRQPSPYDPGPIAQKIAVQGEGRPRKPIIDRDPNSSDVFGFLEPGNPVWKSGKKQIMGKARVPNDIFNSGY